jgi:elongation factor Tu
MHLTDTIGLSRRGWKRRWRRWLVAATALVLLVTAAAAFLLHVVFLLMLVGPLTAAVVLYALFAYLGGRKSSVLYLRRFGLAASGGMVTSALESGMSRRYRIVTLDDSSFRALEVPPWARRFSRYGGPLIALVLIAGFVIVIRYLRADAGPLEYLLLWPLLGLGPAFLAFNAWLLLSVIALLVLHRLRVRRRARGRIESAEQLEDRLRDCVGLSSWARAPAILAPQATVLSVADTMWQTTVSLLVRHVNAVLIDVSEPTSNLLWELEEVFRNGGEHVVLVGDRGKIGAWQREIGSDDAGGGLARSLSALIAARPVLTYDPNDRRGARRFRRSLMSALDNVASTSVVKPAAEWRARWSAAREWSRLRTIGAYALVPAISAALVYAAVRSPRIQAEVAELFVRRDHAGDSWISPVTRLRRRGIEPTTRALVDAARGESGPTAGLLVSAGVQADSAIAGWTALLLAAQSGNEEAARALIAAGANVGARAPDGNTALTIAATRGHETIVDLLLAEGVEVDFAGAGSTGLLNATLGGHSAVVDALLREGADANATDRSSGMSPLLVAAVRGDTSIVKMLLAQRADVNARNQNGRTPLILAAITRCAVCVRALLSANADPSLADRFGQDAVDYAALDRTGAMAGLLGGTALGRAPAAQRSRTKPHVNLLLAGDAAVSASLVSALTRVLSESDDGVRFLSEEWLRYRPVPRSGLTRQDPAHLEFESAQRHYALSLAGGEAGLAKVATSDTIANDGLVLVTSMRDRAAERLRSELRLARVARIEPRVIVLVESAAESELRALLQAERLGDAPIVRVASDAVLGGDANANASILAMIDAIDRHVPTPTRRESRPFLMPVEDIIPRVDSALIAGEVESGIVRPGDTVELVGIRETRRGVVKAISTFGKRLDEAFAGDDVGIHVEGIRANDAERGQVLAAVASIASHSRIEALVYTPGPIEGGPLTPLRAGHRPLLYFRTHAVTGSILRVSDARNVGDGEVALWEIQLAQPVALAPGLAFIVQDDSRRLGRALVTSVR